MLVISSWPYCSFITRKYLVLVKCFQLDLCIQDDITFVISEYSLKGIKQSLQHVGQAIRVLKRSIFSWVETGRKEVIIPNNNWKLKALLMTNAQFFAINSHPALSIISQLQKSLCVKTIYGLLGNSNAVLKCS